MEVGEEPNHKIARKPVLLFLLHMEKKEVGGHFWL
jgi:hypothetical protein